MVTLRGLSVLRRLQPRSSAACSGFLRRQNQPTRRFFRSLLLWWRRRLWTPLPVTSYSTSWWQWRFSDNNCSIGGGVPLFAVVVFVVKNVGGSREWRRLMTFISHTQPRGRPGTPGRFRQFGSAVVSGRWYSSITLSRDLAFLFHSFLEMIDCNPTAAVHCYQLVKLAFFFSRNNRLFDYTGGFFRSLIHHRLRSEFCRVFVNWNNLLLKQLATYRFKYYRQRIHEPIWEFTNSSSFVWTPHKRFLSTLRGYNLSLAESAVI